MATARRVARPRRAALCTRRPGNRAEAAPRGGGAAPAPSVTSARPPAAHRPAQSPAPLRSAALRAARPRGGQRCIPVRGLGTGDSPGGLCPGGGVWRTCVRCIVQAPLEMRGAVRTCGDWGSPLHRNREHSGRKRGRVKRSHEQGHVGALTPAQGAAALGGAGEGGNGQYPQRTAGLRAETCPGRSDGSSPAGRPYCPSASRAARRRRARARGLSVKSRTVGQRPARRRC